MTSKMLLVGDESKKINEEELFDLKDQIDGRMGFDYGGLFALSVTQYLNFFVGLVLFDVGDYQMIYFEVLIPCYFFNDSVMLFMMYSKNPLTDLLL